MSKFWQKKYISKYTGKEIDEAIGKADAIPAVTSADAGKGIVVSEEGVLTIGEIGSADIELIPRFRCCYGYDHLNNAPLYADYGAFVRFGANVIESSDYTIIFYLNDADMALINGYEGDSASFEVLSFQSEFDFIETLLDITINYPIFLFYNGMPINPDLTDEIPVGEKNVSAFVVSTQNDEGYTISLRINYR